MAKASPGKLSYASAGRGTPAHLAGELFKLAFGVDMTHVPFTGGGPAMTATLGGHTPCVVSALPTGAPYARAGNIRALAMMSAKRSPLLPRGTDHGRGDRHQSRGGHRDRARGSGGNAAARSSICSTAPSRKSSTPRDFNDRLLALGFDPVASTPDQFADWIKDEIAKWGKVIREANITVQ